MQNENLIALRELRNEEKELKKTIDSVKEAAIDEAIVIVPNGGTFEIENVGKYNLKLNPTYDLSEEKGKLAREWHKMNAEYNNLQEQIDSLKRKQSNLREDMDKLGEKHIAATAATDHPYKPEYKRSISVL